LTRHASDSTIPALGDVPAGAYHRINAVDQLLALLLITASPTSHEVEHAGVRIRTTVRSQVYTWDVTNVSAGPITEFEVPQHAGYDFQAPEGWLVEAASDRFRARTTSLRLALLRGQTAVFAQRVSSSGGVVGRVTARVGLSVGEPVEVPGVWAPQPEPRSAIYTVPMVVVCIVVLHAARTLRRNRKRPAELTAP
jgi:hypothetical protein